MRISLCSDLHLEGQSIQGFSGGDVLLLAGDTAEIRNWPRFTSFFEEISEKFRDIYTIAGNHEYYGGTWEGTIQSMKEIVAPWKNIRVMENEAVEIAPDVMLYGSTFWTNFNETYSSMQECKHTMNDYACIRKGNGFLHPEDVLEKYEQSLKDLDMCLGWYPTKKFIVMTHHAPSHKSIHEWFKKYPDLNGGFVNDLDQFVWDHPNIKYWVHGHTHNSFNYKIGTCQVYCNPRGYGKENRIAFKKDFSFEV